ncbi:thyrotroph embryonic factor isoform X2 [Homalodisca vitripennis]|uniref:BZIP domain-containing protein n=1 Tax=Homalodisca liturata TaxID=320908 RepID=A0A1B6K2P1_9HEMI|nr:thyrotroph embryonic factor isoform X2 [Homalodisca vitripennis]
MYEAKCIVMDYHNHAAPAQQPPHQLHHQFHQLHPLAPDTSSRWSQYQQLWRQHQMFINGESVVNCGNLQTNKVQGKSCGKESPDKKDDNELWSNVEAQAAFLGPNLWEKTLSYDSDLKYVDLDEFLSENGIPVEGGTGTGMPNGMSPHKPESGRISPSSSSQQSMLPKRERSPSPSEPMSPLNVSPPSPADSTLSFASSSRDFDPRTRAFSDEELKPQPMVKKSRKQFVPDGMKDEKYWARRRKNNMAAKRSRDARRLKENQIALRAGFLEKENIGLRQEMERLKKENLSLRDRLSKFTEI